MSDQRVTVWVQRFKDRPALMLQWIDPETGKRKSESAGTADPDQAEQKRADKEYELNHGLHKEVSRMSWERFRELFEAEYLSGARANTRRNYAATLDLFEELCRPGALRSVSGRTVSTFVGAMRKRPTRGREGMAASTIRVYLEYLHTALAWAAHQNFIPACPRFPDVKVPKKRPQPVPTESFEKLLDKAPDALTRAYLLCGWLAGLRLNEGLALEWEQTDAAPWVDFARNRIWLPAGFVKAAEDQWVPLDPVLCSALEPLPRHGRKVFRFLSRKTGEPICLEGMSQRIVKLARRAGVKLSMHALRKGFGCRYAGKVPAQVLQRLMRHSSIAITMDYYANVDAAVEEAVLGRQCNSSRNTPAATPSPAKTLSDASPFLKRVNPTSSRRRGVAPRSR
jgi:integrase